MRRINVIIPVAIPTPEEPKFFVAKTVASADAAVLTKLFPIRTVIINWRGFYLSPSNVFEPGMFCFARVSACSLLTDINAVSAHEKNAEMQIKIIRMSMSIIIKNQLTFTSRTFLTFFNAVFSIVIWISSKQGILIFTRILLFLFFV